MSKKKTDSKLRIIPLGGLGEIGKNMTVFEYGDDIIVVDIGSIFPREDMPGVDLVIPDTAYLEKNFDKLRGYVITHGHEDHIGASPYILKKLPAPVYGTRLTLALVDHKLKEHRVNGIELHVTMPGETVEIGAFKVEFIHVNHSITGAVALAIHTPAGIIVHTGDFKVDYTPIDDHTTDLGRLAQLGCEGVLALLCDSTNIERPGYTMSERKVGETFNTYFQKAEGRIIVAMFASNIHRIQQVVDAAVRYNRRVCLVGRSMVNVSKVAVQLGELVIPEGRLLSIDDIDRCDDDELVIITTGSQGEPMSGLARMAFAEHKKLEIKASDMVIISATPIPGNEKSVSRVINQLVRTGAEVVYEALAEVHVSGHACQEEIKLIHTLVHPKYFIPVHGEYRHLYQHAEIAKMLGMNEENVLIANVGDKIELSPSSMEVTDSVPSGEVLIDGLGVGDVGNVVLRDRKHLSQDGLLIIVLAVDRESGQVISGPDIISRGFVYVRESDDLVEGAKVAVRQVLSEYSTIDSGEWNAVKSAIRDAVQRYVYATLKRSPMILSIIMDI
ncbi:MAG: ribonuclease J [Clostridia bacterium]|nr:ribonuclease J [Clostridia bacterium]